MKQNSVFSVAKRVAAKYWDPTNKTTLEDEVSETETNEFAAKLQTIADDINGFVDPGLSLTAGNISKLAKALRVSDAKSLARNIRKELWEQIMALVPPEKWDMSAGDWSGFFDTNPVGKGSRDGYVSFGARPMVWADAALIGGISFRFQYSAKGIAPKPGTPERQKWEEDGDLGIKNPIVEVGDLTGGYYNKQLDGGIESFSGKSMGHTFGRALFEVDANENVLSWIWEDPSSTRAAIESVIDDILAHPPIGAYSKNKKLLRRRNNYTSLKKFLGHLVFTRRNNVYLDEVKLVAQAMGTVPNTVISILKQKGYVYHPVNAPFPVP